VDAPSLVPPTRARCRYRWLIEGFETRDLKEAKALLEELPACWTILFEKFGRHQPLNRQSGQGDRHVQLGDVFCN
jgi:hypothetical protein